MRMVKVGCTRLDADKFLSFEIRACTVCGWHVYFDAVMVGKERLKVDELSWHREWGEFGNHEAHQRGVEAIEERLDVLSRQIEGTCQS